VPHSQRRSDQASRSRSEKEPERLPIYFSRFVGVTVEPIVWTEDISGSEERESLWGLGLKLTGPDVVLTGPIMELNAFIHFGAPKTLERISTIQPYGFILALDTSVVLPFLQRQNLVGFFSAGPLALYSTFKMAESGRLTDRDSLQVGAALAIGFAQRFDRVTIRLEGKSLIARKTYPVAQLSIQTQF
jgi:hypothetical protein